MLCKSGELTLVLPVIAACVWSFFLCGVWGEQWEPGCVEGGNAGRAADSDCTTAGPCLIPEPPLWSHSLSQHVLDRSCCFEIFPLAFSSSPLITHSKNSMPPVKASEPSARHHRPPPPLLTLSLTYMVKSPAALVPCCKTILPLWEAVEFPLLMVQMAPACKPLTEMFLDSVSAGGRGRGRGWSEGWSLQAVISIPWFYCIAHTWQGSAAASSASLTQLVAAFLWSQVPQPKAWCCQGSVCRICAPAAGWSSLFTHLLASSQGGFVKPGWFSRWPFGPLSASHTPAVPSIWIVGPWWFFSLTTVIS